MNITDRAARLREIDEVIAAGPYQDNWDSLVKYQVPEWYKNAKFGIFIHWGIYSVPAFGSEWYSRNMYRQGSREYEHHIETYGKHTEFGYKDFIPMFKAEKFDPEKWAELFVEAGAKYVVPVAEHHDGFAMYKSDLTEWNAAEMGPCRDVVGELSNAFNKNGLTVCCSSHRIEHFWFMGDSREFDSDIKGEFPVGHIYWPTVSPTPKDHFDSYYEPAPTKEFMDDWLMRCCELVDKYQPKLFYFDWWIHHNAAKPYLKKFAAYFYNKAQAWGGGVICYKHDSFVFGSALPDVERGQFPDVQPFYWQTDTAVARNSWCYTDGNQFKPAGALIRQLVDVVSKNGNLLLNIGPRADGTITDEDAHVLRTIGGWLKVNGEAIYGSRFWRLPAEGPTRPGGGQFTDKTDPEYTSEDFRFTVNGQNLYVTSMLWPENGEILVKSMWLGGSHGGSYAIMPESVSILGYDEKPEWKLDKEGLHLSAPFVKSDLPVVIKLTSV